MLCLQSLYDRNSLVKYFPMLQITDANPLLKANEGSFLMTIVGHLLIFNVFFANVSKSKVCFVLIERLKFIFAKYESI